MRKMRTVMLSAAIVTSLCWAAPSLAQMQEQQPHMLTWANLVKVKPGKWMDFQNTFEKYDKPVLEKLLSEGTVVEWGLAYQMAGPPGGSYVTWVDATDWASLGKVEAAFEAARKSMAEADMKKLMESYVSDTEPDAAHTIVLRHLVSEEKRGAAPKYLTEGVYKAKPGKGHLATGMYKEYVAPLYKKLLDEGKILGYGLAVQDMHTDPSWTHAGWVLLSDLSQEDSVDQAWDEAEKARSRGANEVFDAAFTSWAEPGAHFDVLYHIVMFGAHK